MNLDDSVRSALAFLEPDIKAQNAALVVQNPLPSVMAHPATLLILIQNLISNALKFMAPGIQPKVDISAEEYLENETASPPLVRKNPAPPVHGLTGDQPTSPRRFIRLSVRDNGIGIPSADIPSLFAAFHRLHGKDEYPGTGLGLAIVRKAAERMGGRVGVESAPGQGSRFWLDLAGADPERPRAN